MQQNQTKPSKLQSWNAVAGIIAGIIALSGFLGIKSYTDVLGPRWVKANQQTEKTEETPISESLVEVKENKDINYRTIAIVYGDINSNNNINKAIPLPTPVKVRGSKYKWGENSSSIYVDMWAEKVEIGSGKTILSLAFAGSSVCYLGSASESYIADNNGNIFDILQDNGEYGGLFSLYRRTIRENEVYRTTLVFPEIKDKTPYIILHHPRFSSLHIRLNWNN